MSRNNIKWGRTRLYPTKLSLWHAYKIAKLLLANIPTESAQALSNLVHA
ncbi:hypothetical protein KM92DES2_12868 [uncultured Desulfovibrio sp.]|uniref:Uncharacterized protein n=1 Tax=uncultured Desulfovibrio sp. TaxID=167968 RepID=A0A212KE89_9BACT|nr:hypothetical protein KM92DES2_12868 [uncultured Desulfovibrio sp.]